MKYSIEFRFQDYLLKTIVAKDNCLKIEVFSDYKLDDEVITFNCV